MAGDWMKVELSTPDKPEVFAIADALGIDPDAAFGKLFRVWSWFDQHTEKGNAPSVTKMIIDRCAGVTGFAAAMESVGWLEVTDAGVTLPNFSRHNGKTGKNRALTAKRVAEHKKKGNEKGNGDSVTNALPREEKRREEDIYPAKAGTRKTAMPKNFGVSDRVREWATKHGHTRLDDHLTHFKLTAEAKGYKYADWDAALMNAIRNNWAKVQAEDTGVGSWV